MAGFSDRSFAFFEGLEANNEKAWYDANKKIYEQEVREPLALMLEMMGPRLEDEGIQLSGGKKTMFRLNRDIRFSKNKKPYKENAGGLLTPNGIKNETGGLVYVQLDKTGGFCAAGYHNLDAKRLKPIRQKIIDKPKDFAAVLDHLKKHKMALEMDNSLSAMPRGFEEHADHDYADYLKLKSFIIMQKIPKTAWKNGDVVDRVINIAKAGWPLIKFGRV